MNFGAMLRSWREERVRGGNFGFSEQAWDAVLYTLPEGLNPNPADAFRLETDEVMVTSRRELASLPGVGVKAMELLDAFMSDNNLSYGGG